MPATSLRTPHFYHNTPAKDFEAGDDERDCALFNKDTNTMIFDWA